VGIKYLSLILCRHCRCCYGYRRYGKWCNWVGLGAFGVGTGIGAVPGTLSVITGAWAFSWGVSKVITSWVEAELPKGVVDEVIDTVVEDDKTAATLKGTARLAEHLIPSVPNLSNKKSDRYFMFLYLKLMIKFLLHHFFGFVQNLMQFNVLTVFN